MKIKDKLKKVKFINNYVVNKRLKRMFINDYIDFKDKYMYSIEDIETIGYHILLVVHTTEKAMLNQKPRVFGGKKMELLMELLNKYISAYDTESYYFKMGLSCLYKYKEFFEKNNWTATEEYKKVYNYLEKNSMYKENMLNVGNTTLDKQDILNSGNMDYYNFLKSRHSVRNYSSKKLKNIDVEKAIDMAMFTPTACNRQMCKIYFVDSEEKKNEVIEYANGFGNFQLENVNIFLITYDIRSLSMGGERNQGWLNSGLVAMNLVNAFHSLGIGSCLLQSSNTYKEENELKKKLNIPKYERIAVIISAGYYDDKSLIANSVRKNKMQIYRKI